MDRVTDKMLITKIEKMQTAGMDVGLDGQYGRFLVTNKSGDRNLSPRTTNSHIWDWLCAFESGWSARRAYILGPNTGVTNG